MIVDIDITQSIRELIAKNHGFADVKSTAAKIREIAPKQANVMYVSGWMTKMYFDGQLDCLRVGMPKVYSIPSQPSPQVIRLETKSVDALSKAVRWHGLIQGESSTVDDTLLWLVTEFATREASEAQTGRSTQVEK